MKISVIIPIKNRAHLLPVTLDNILSQSLKPYEIIVVDDGSTDDLQGVANMYASKVIFMSSKGKGPGAARNTGLSAATGTAIQYFDSDDLMTRNKLKVQASLLSEKNADFVYGPSVKAAYMQDTWQQVDVIMQYYPLPARQLSNLVLEGWCAITQSALFSKSLINEVGKWREDLMPHDDYEYWFRIGKIAKNFYHENESCVIYRQHQHQITGSSISDQTRWLDGLKAREFIEKGINFSPRLSSLLLFKGNFAESKLKFIRKYGSSPGLHMSFFDYLYIPYYKALNKIGRLRTGTEWQKIHGVLPTSGKEFSQYIALV